MPHVGEPELVGMIWRVPVHTDFPVPESTDILPFRNLAEILIDDGSGEVLNVSSSREREARLTEEIGRVLAEIYNEIPAFDCERCGRCCGPIGATAMELDLIDEHVRRNHIEVPEYIQTVLSTSFIARTTISVRCPYLKDQACMVYSVRPTVCRLFGTVTTHMPCVTGGRVLEPITHVAAFHLLRKVEVLSTLWSLMKKHEWAVES
jgi:Fe-S-cluster containining protein